MQRRPLALPLPAIGFSLAISLGFANPLGLAAPALAQPAEPRSAPPAAAPVLPAANQAPPVIPLMRVVPKGEARAIAFYASLHPDCSPQGPVVIRMLSQPQHGKVSFPEEASFTRYGSGSPLSACNTRKVPGRKMVYESEEGFEGLDSFRIFVINADGTGYESEIKVSVR